LGREDAEKLPIMMGSGSGEIKITTPRVVRTGQKEAEPPTPVSVGPKNSSGKKKKGLGRMIAAGRT